MMMPDVALPGIVLPDGPALTGTDASPMSDVAVSEVERRHIAELLASVERQSHVSQRKLASELGVALGLVNTYIKRCVKKGLIKVQHVPSRRYAYHLTPHGFAEKSRLTAEYLSWSLTFFRRARADCALVLEEAKSRGWRRVGLVGGSDLAEIAILAAIEQGVTVAGLVEPGMRRRQVMGVSAFSSPGDIEPQPDGWIVTGIEDPQAQHDALAAASGAHSVLAPRLLSVRHHGAEQP
jgi:DNA-binding MarR family transcriptional regulator